MTATGGAGVAETHSAVVFFVGDRAYKLKKPVDLGFLDFRERAAREAVCRREVALNRRLAPDVYLGVADVSGPDGEVCDHLVVMRRMPPDRRLSTLVAEGHPVEDHLWALAHLLAAFHARAERSDAADAAASPGALAGRWSDNTASLAAHAGVVDPATVERVQALAMRYLEGRRPLFRRRIAEGRACDGHGDLLADDVFLLDDGPRVLDCIEFDDGLRYGDTLADVAFLAMDLERLGRPDLAERFLRAYREHADDTWPASLEHHHVAYRAQVRAKVTAIRAAQGHGEAVPEARRLLGTALRHLEAGRVRLVLVGGLPGTGKSTLARALGDALGATVLRSDEMRKELAGIPADRHAPDAFGQGIYSATATADTYGELVRRAEVALGMGETVVLDASWNEERWRERARAAAVRVHADLVELRCAAPAEVAAARIRARTAAGDDVSDASPAVAAAMAVRADPWPAAVTISTEGAPSVTVATALDAVSAGAP
ncbi:MAG TPA: AAA family ATPase [Acidimicrobiales bacterium]